MSEQEKTAGQDTAVCCPFCKKFQHDIAGEEECICGTKYLSIKQILQAQLIDANARIAELEGWIEDMKRERDRALTSHVAVIDELHNLQRTYRENVRLSVEDYDSEEAATRRAGDDEHEFDCVHHKPTPERCEISGVEPRGESV